MSMLSWIYAARPKTLVASIVPVISASLILPDKDIFKLDIFIVAEQSYLKYKKAPPYYA